MIKYESQLGVRIHDGERGGHMTRADQQVVGEIRGRERSQPATELPPLHVPIVGLVGQYMPDANELSARPNTAI